MIVGNISVWLNSFERIVPKSKAKVCCIAAVVVIAVSCHVVSCEEIELEISRSAHQKWLVGSTTNTSVAVNKIWRFLRWKRQNVSPQNITNVALTESFYFFSSVSHPIHIDLDFGKSVCVFQRRRIVSFRVFLRVWNKSQRIRIATRWRQTQTPFNSYAESDRSKTKQTRIDPLTHTPTIQRWTAWVWVNCAVYFVVHHVRVASHRNWHFCRQNAHTNWKRTNPVPPNSRWHCWIEPIGSTPNVRKNVSNRFTHDRHEAIELLVYSLDAVPMPGKWKRTVSCCCWIGCFMADQHKNSMKKNVIRIDGWAETHKKCCPTH